MQWTKITSIEAGDRGPGKYDILRLAMYRSGNRYRATAEEEYGQSQGGALHPDGSRTTEGRGDSAEGAVGIIRADVTMWQAEDAARMHEWRTALRQLVYATEDAETE